MDRSLLPRPEDVEVDKLNNEWLLSYSVNEQITLRLRLQHSQNADPDDAICEIRETPDGPFREVGRLLLAPIELDPDCWHLEPDLSDWPLEYRDAFVRLARVWSVCTGLAEWGYALGDKQAQWDAYFLGSSSATAASEPPRGDQ